MIEPVHQFRPVLDQHATRQTVERDAYLGEMRLDDGEHARPLGHDDDFVTGRDRLDSFDQSANLRTQKESFEY
jgi:hypothetical protein